MTVVLDEDTNTVTLLDKDKLQVQLSVGVDGTVSVDHRDVGIVQIETDEAGQYSLPHTEEFQVNLLESRAAVIPAPDESQATITTVEETVYVTIIESEVNF